MTEFLDNISGGASTAAISEAIGSQLAGRTDGPADALRHILIAAELTRKYPETYVDFLLDGHELYQGGAGSAMDNVNNGIGKTIGNYVKTNGGTWQDVIRILQEIIEVNLSGYTPQNIDNFLSPQDGGNFVVPMTALLDGGNLAVPGISLLETKDWLKNPIVNGQPISSGEANWPDLNGDWKLNFVPETYDYQEHINYTPTPANPSTINNSLLNSGNTLSPDSNNATADDGDFVNGTVISGGDYTVSIPSLTLNEDGLINNLMSGTASDVFRPGAFTLADTNLITTFNNTIRQINSDPVSTALNNSFAGLTTLHYQAPNVQNIDPLVLDLNDNGVELISFADSNVTFDVDNDGFVESTGWVAGTDGILVEDKNQDGFFRQENANSVFRKNEHFALAKSRARVVFKCEARRKATKRVDINSILKNLKTKSVCFLSANCFLNTKSKVKVDFNNDNFANDNSQNCVVMKHQQKIINF
ncbi:MAG: hypothetical protein ACJAS6_000560 [Rickettsiales bacterium]|jgi:hypothetical protein